MAYSINKAAVIGAGTMGMGIAGLLAGAGVNVVLLDIVPPTLSDEEKAKGVTVDTPAFRNKFAEGSKARALKGATFFDKSHADRITTGNIEDHLELLKDCDWIVEVVLEKIEVKKDLLKKIAPFVSPTAIVSSNTSGVSINKIVSDMDADFKSRFLGTHFFNPPRFMKLFEMIPGESTSPEVLAFMESFAEGKLGKGVVKAKDTTNFISNLIGVFASINVIHLMEKFNFNIERAEILSGPILGRPRSATFRTADLVGIDILGAVSNNVLNNSTNAKEIEAWKLPTFVQELIDNKQLGDKTGMGFYKKVKTEAGRQILIWNPATKDYEAGTGLKIDSVNAALKSSNKFSEMAYGTDEDSQFVWETLKAVLLYCASKIPEIADDYKEIDKAMTWGYNWEKGPFEIWDALGLEKSVEKMKAEGEEIPAWITEKIASGDTTFYKANDYTSKYLRLSDVNEVVKDNGDARLIQLGDNVLGLQIQSKGNSISDKVIEMMFEANEALACNESNYAGLVVSSEGKHFSAGASLVNIYDYSSNKDWNKLESEITRLQQGLMALKFAKKPVVATPYGMTVGGGAELTMHSHEAVAAAESYVGLVEAGVGLVPGGGGNKELLLRSIRNAGGKLSKHQLNEVTKDVWNKIATGKVSGSAFEAVSSNFMKADTQILLNKDAQLSAAKAKVLEMSANGFQPLTESIISVAGKDGYAYLMYTLEAMEKGHFVSEYDAHIAKKIAYIVTGGNVLAGATVSEQNILDLEKEAFISLCGEEKTLQRIEHMLKKGKPLRN